MEYVIAGDFDFLFAELRGCLMSWLMVATGRKKNLDLVGLRSTSNKNKKAVLFCNAYTNPYNASLSRQVGIRDRRECSNDQRRENRRTIDSSYPCQGTGHFREPGAGKGSRQSL